MTWSTFSTTLNESTRACVRARYSIFHFYTEFTYFMCQIAINRQFMALISFKSGYSKFKVKFNSNSLIGCSRNGPITNIYIISIYICTQMVVQSNAFDRIYQRFLFLFCSLLSDLQHRLMLFAFVTVSFAFLNIFSLLLLIKLFISIDSNNSNMNELALLQFSEQIVWYFCYTLKVQRLHCIDWIWCRWKYFHWLAISF